jgi:hypothetical protein
VLGHGGLRVEKLKRWVWRDGSKEVGLKSELFDSELRGLRDSRRVKCTALFPEKQRDSTPFYASR